MRSPQTVPLVIQHRTLSRPSTAIPIPAPPSPAGSGRYHIQGREEDVDMESDDGGMDSPPPLTTSQSLDDNDHLLTPPSHLLFGGPLTPVHALKGQVNWASGPGGDAKGKAKAMDTDEGMEAEQSSASALLHAPPEILHRILCYSAGEDVRSIARSAATCRELRSYIYENPDQALWRDIHLALYDDPRMVDGESTSLDNTSKVNWRKTVQDREVLREIFAWPEDRYDELPGQLDFISDTLLDMYLDIPSLPDPTRVSPLDDIDADDMSEADNAPSTSVPLPASHAAEPEDTIPSPNALLLHAYLTSPIFEHLVLHCATRETQPVLRPMPGRTGMSGGSPLRRTFREVINTNLSRLHCLLPPTLERGDKLQCDYRGFVRELVYSSRYYQERNEWAPLDERGRVDWRLVDAISTVMMANAKDVIAAGETSWVEAIGPLSYGLSAVRSWSTSRVDRPLHLDMGSVWDWAGVEGKWCGSYAFLDYSDWIALNEPRIVLLRRSMADLDLAHYTEAVGDLLHMQLQLINPTEHAAALASRRTGMTEELLPLVSSSLPTSNRLPPIHFKGVSAQAAGNMTHPSGAPHSIVRGVVQLTADDPPQVRWTVVIRYTGADRWKIEGVQVGGRGSKRGFFGVWTDAEKEEHSPNGPTWYWKA